MRNGVSIARMQDGGLRVEMPALESVRWLLVPGDGGAPGKIPFPGFKFTTRKQVSRKRSFVSVLPALNTVLCFIRMRFYSVFSTSNHSSELGHLTAYKIPDFQLLMFRSSYIKYTRKTTASIGFSSR